MGKIVTKVALIAIGVLMVISYFHFVKHPLIGEWISHKGEGVGFMHDPKAPYTVVFTEDEIKILDKSIAINYILKTEKKDTLYLEAKKDGARLEVIQLDNGKIQFYFPGNNNSEYPAL